MVNGAEKIVSILREAIWHDTETKDWAQARGLSDLYQYTLGHMDALQMIADAFDEAAARKGGEDHEG